MRCRECNIDLGDNYTQCPLCGTQASNDLPTLTGIKDAPYPDYSITQPKHRLHSDFPQKYVLRAAVGLVVLFGIGSLAGIEQLWQYCAPALMAATAIFYLISGILEKSPLLHSALSLISCIAIVITLLLISLVIKTGIVFFAVALIVCIISFAILFTVKPEKMRNQLRASFYL